MLGERLKELRESKKLTQQEMADLLGIARGTYAHYEINRREPDNATLIKLSTFFKVSLDHLLGQDNIYDVGHIIAEEREEQGLSVKELAESVGISEIELYRHEQNDEPLTEDLAEKIAKTLGMSFVELRDKYNLYVGDIHPEFDGDVNKQIAFDKARDQDALNEPYPPLPRENFEITPADIELLRKIKSLPPEKRKAIEILAGPDEQAAGLGK